MNTINLKAIKNCLMAVSNDKDRLNLTGVYIEDRDGYRHYVGSNGHVLIHAFDELNENDKLEKALILKPHGKIGNIKKKCYGKLKIINAQKVLIESSNVNVFCDIIDSEYPTYHKVFPKGTQKAKEFAWFNPKYLKIVREIFKRNDIKIPLMADRNSPALWSDYVDCTGYDVVVMPIRIAEA